MTWWTTAAGLTPVAAFDASRISDTQLLDGVGVNHITATSTLLPNDFQLKSVAGNGNPMALTTPIPMPATGVVAGFWAPKRRTVLLTPGYNDTSGYALHLSDNGQGWHAAKANASAPYGLYGSIGTRYFVAMVTRGSDSILYVDGNLVGIPVSSSYTMSQIGQIGYGANGNEYNLDTDEFFHALGVWTGVATQADIRAIEAAVRLELAGVPPSFHGYGTDLSRVNTIPTVNLATQGLGDNTGRINTAPIQALDGLGVRNKTLLPILGKHDIYFGGVGQVVGTVKNSPATPVRRRVLLIEEATRAVIRETWSEAATGVYSFSRVAMNTTYTVVSYDHTQAFRAVVADRVKPDLMLEYVP